VPKDGSGHSALWAWQLVQDLSNQGVSPERLLGNVGLNLSELREGEARIPFARIALLFERAAELTKNDLLGLQRGAARDERHAGLIAYVGLSSATVLDCLNNLARYSRVFSDAIEIDVSALASEGQITWAFDVPEYTQRGQFLEFGLSGTVSELRRITGHSQIVEDVGFRHHRVRNVKEVEKFFRCRVNYSQPLNNATISERVLRQPLLTRDDHLLKVLRRYCEETIEKLPSPKRSTRAITERAISETISSGVFDQKSIATRLGMSSRSLSRKLAEEGTTFREVLKVYRRELATVYLTRSSLQMLEIAFLLGYEDASSFSSAFRRWTGNSPTSLKRKRISEDLLGQGLSRI